MPVAPAPAPTESRTWAECLAVWAVLALFFEVGLNNINHRAYMGQDFYLHVHFTTNLLQHPDHWFAGDTTNRPLIFWLGGLCHRLTGGEAPYMLAALCCVVLNAAALWLLHDSSRRFITSPALRVAGLALVAFLPATLIGSVVYAGDAVAQLPFALLGWSLLRGAAAGSRRAGWGWALLAGAALCLGNFAKFTFITLPPAVLVILLLLRRWGRITRGFLLAASAGAVVAPLLAGLWLHHLNQRDVAGLPDRHQFNWAGTGEMTWSSLLLVQGTDTRIFSAPGYWDTTTVKGEIVQPLLVANSYSYPALLQLGTFTDVLDFSRRFVTGLDVPRPEPQRSFAQWSVRGGLLFSLPALAAIILLLVRTAQALVRPVTAPAVGLLAWGLLSLAWFLPLVLVLPFVHRAYDAGYWLPRLVLPALWGFGLVLYGAIDRLAARHRWLVPLTAVLTAGQAWVQIRSVWY
jgi:4-amino-4-deoxy-L-arabinose transferase-like glycosyltransferase